MVNTAASEISTKYASSVKETSVGALKMALNGFPLNKLTKISVKIPAPIPTNKSTPKVNKIVTMKINSCSFPISKVCMNSLGCVNLIPTVISMAAKAVLGINSIKWEANKTKTKMKNPWKKLAQRVFAPFAILADERATSEIMGKPPKNATNVLPIPVAIKSLFAFDLRLNGSNISIAFTVNNDSKEPTKANMITNLIKVPVCAKPSKLAFMWILSNKFPM